MFDSGYFSGYPYTIVFLMNAEFVHQRDLTKILEEIYDGLDKYKQNSRENTDFFVDELNSLINQADRDIRLKTQTIVRSRLAQSQQLGIKTLPTIHKVKVIPSDKLPPIPVLYNEPVIEDSLKNKYAPDPPKTIKKPINPIARPETKNSTRNRSMSTSSRRPFLPKRIDRLPHLDIHDPTAPPPSIPDNSVSQHGVLRLRESKLMTDEQIEEAFNGLLSVNPFQYDFTFLPSYFKQPYVLDPGAPSKRSPKQLDTMKLMSNYQPMASLSSTINQPRPILVLINGIPLSSSLEFISFRRAFSNMWEQVEIVLEMISKYCESHSLNRTRIDGRALIELSKLDPDDISDERLKGCFIDNSEETKKKSKKFGFGFIGPNAESKAATVIQSLWRGFYARRLVRMIRRNNAAARIIQRSFRSSLAMKKFRSFFDTEKKRRIKAFETYQSDPNSYQTTGPHMYLHLIEDGTSCEVGRLLNLKDHEESLIVFFTKKTIPTSVMEMIRSQTNTPNRIIFHSPTLPKLPSSFSIELSLFCDTKAISKIKVFSNSMPIVIIPNKMCDAIVDTALALSAVVISTGLMRVSMYETRESIRRLLSSSGQPIFEGSDSIYDRQTLCRTLTDISVMNLHIQQWMIRNNSSSVGWVKTNEFSLLEQLQDHKEVLRPDDIENDHFRELMTLNISNDLNSLITTINQQTVPEFLRECWLSGATIEAAPVLTKSSPEIGIYIPPIGSPKVIGTWERLFTAPFEPFARIHPSFTVDKQTLIQQAQKITSECSSKRLIGYNVITYYFSPRTILNSINEEEVNMILTADDIKISSINQVRSQLTAEHFSKRLFDEESFSMGPSTYIYVQEHLKLPEEVDVIELIEKLAEFSMPMDTRVFLFPSFYDPCDIGMIVIEENAEKLVTLVHRVLIIMIESLFKMEDKPNHPLISYCASLEFLKDQFEENKEIKSTFMVKKGIKKDMKSPSMKKVILDQAATKIKAEAPATK